MNTTIITSGDMAVQAIAKAWQERIVSWIDILVEGPWYDGLSFREFDATRACALEQFGWTTFEEAFKSLSAREGVYQSEDILLFFEDDPVDILQLIHFYHYFNKSQSLANIRLVTTSNLISKLSENEIKEGISRAEVLKAEDGSFLKSAWTAITSGNLVYLSHPVGPIQEAIFEAVTRRIEQHPSANDRSWAVSAGDQLPRSDMQILSALADGPVDAATLYQKSQIDAESRRFVSDLMFELYLKRLLRGSKPYIRLVSGGELPPAGDTEFWSCLLMRNEVF